MCRNLWLAIVAFAVVNPLTTSAQSLSTRWAMDVQATRPLPEYPRPQFAREKWLSLNGQWQYAIRPREAVQPMADQFDGQIVVPFAVESALSGVKKPVGAANRLWYRQTFAVPQEWKGNRIVLHFGAVDWETSVWVNGRKM